MTTYTTARIRDRLGLRPNRPNRPAAAPVALDRLAERDRNTRRTA